jgi:hypothetical protein
MRDVYRTDRDILPQDEDLDVIASDNFLRFDVSIRRMDDEYDRDDIRFVPMRSKGRTPWKQEQEGPSVPEKALQAICAV